MVKYLGSKRALVPLLEELARRAPVQSACDLFSGTTRVGQAMRRAGLVVHSNDLATYSEALGQAYVAADEVNVDRRRLRGLIAELNALPGVDGYVTRTFCEESRFFQPKNGRRIDAVRDRIDQLDLTEIERGVLLTSLLEAADRVDSTCGVQMAYVKRWAARAERDLELREPQAVAGPAGRVSRRDATELAADLAGTDLAYLDPPYNQHSYFSNYHVWETLVRWDAPEHYGVACKRVDCRTTKSAFNSRRTAWDALERLVLALDTPWVVLSFSDEGFHAAADIEALLGEKGHVGALTVDHPRYVGARIGIHNPQGEKVGTVSHVRNRETLWVSGPSRTDLAALLDGLGRGAPTATARAA